MIRGLLPLAPSGAPRLGLLTQSPTRKSARRPRAKTLAAKCLAAAFLAGMFVAGAMASPAAHADEIIVRDPDTGAQSSINAWGITSESWSEVGYKERERSAVKTVPTLTVVRIKRKDKSASANSLRLAIADLQRGNYAEAAEALRSINGGGTNMDLETGVRKFVSFSENDPKGRNKRPTWISEYSHFYYAKARYLEGVKNKNLGAIREALNALENVKIKDGEGMTGGFLKRFAGGNSRFYAEALSLAANALTRVSRYDDAQKLFNELDTAAIKVPLAPRWLYEGAIGAGAIAEAQGDLTGAVSGYNAAGNKLWVILGKEQKKWMLAEVGRYISRARTRTSAVMLASAEKRRAASAFRELRAHIAGGSPEALRKKATGRGLSKAAIAAIVAGARDPSVQAVSLNGMGLAYLSDAKPSYEQALLAFKAVTVKYFQEPEQHARALYYLAKAADGAAEGAKGEVKAMYAAMVDEATKMLRDQHPDSEWARR